MTSVRLIWLLLCLLWVCAEIWLARQSRPERRLTRQVEYQSQRWLWLSILGSLMLAFGFKQMAWLPIPLPYLPRQLPAILVFGCGLGLRFWAVNHLGQFFTTHVTIQQQHQLITNGPYRIVRHPAYTGLLLALAAAGLAMGDFLAFLCLTIPVFWGFQTRMNIEERMLLQEFGAVYESYCQTSWRLLPWLY
ncbi:methyltransferase family protein [Methylomonas methanica]|uniref:Isoprenylcysteine carboxyl methyltransferase n=1 Tax=Methylomonas methanica (strain DSM 25384 / MC09) TaxID=857087 RepID=F9ZYL5_METMM|nr:isoprenylcysteine carboxylmethyltransferase family protein [Methylomonas methanica]AEG02287.1 Isoprenylcysteine carboxyl methyltransferase [Methylomonas methanica MC09]